MFSKFIQISLVPTLKRLAAQRRVREERITAVPLTNDQFRVRSSRGYHNVLSRDAILNEDFYEVRTFDSDGELFATCTCPFGQKGEDADANVCKHIEAALAVRSTRVPSVPKLPEFVRGRIVIDVNRNSFTVSATAHNDLGASVISPTTRIKRITSGTGLTAINKILGLVDREF